MHSPLKFSIFNDVIFPKEDESRGDDASSLVLRKTVRHQLAHVQQLSTVPMVVFDFETTGLDDSFDQIIEVGAQKIVNFEVESEFSSLIKPDMKLPIEAQRVTGITQDMLEGQPLIEEVLPRFLDFISGSLLVAHNASFDMGFLRMACAKAGVDIEWPALCTLKMARELLPELERKTLDALATHYDLHFEARHRSVGDVKVTVGVLREMLNEEGNYLKSWKDVLPFSV